MAGAAAARSDTVEVEMLPAFYDAFEESAEDRIVTFYGGAGSGKTWSLAQRLLSLLVTEDDLRLLIVMKTSPQLRVTVFQDLQDIIESWKIPVNINLTRMDLKHGTSVINCRGLDKPQKIKSYNANIIWMEEATDFTIKEFRHLRLRLRRPHNTVKNQIFLSFNPIDQWHWCVTDLIEGDLSDYVMHSTYKNNPFMDEHYRQELLDLEKQDYNFYRIYTLGEPGVLENIIYNPEKWETRELELWPQALRQRRPTCYGLDFGFHNPTALLALWRFGKVHYIHEILYRTGMTNIDLVEWFKDNPDKVFQGIPIYADPSRPDQIQDISRAGFNIYKGNNRVKDGIDYCKGHQEVISTASPNVIKEQRSYSYREDKDGHVLDEPVDFMNHAMDAKRYMIFTSRPAIGGTRTVPMQGAYRDGPSNIPSIYIDKRIPGM
jgi:phage terminase large subunit